MRFLRFSQIQLPGGKICDWYIILQYFAKHLTPMLNPGRVHKEMGHLWARTPYVECHDACRQESAKIVQKPLFGM